MPGPDPVDVGAKVLAALAEGRRLAIEQAQGRAALLERRVRRELDIDVMRGRGERGRAKRLALALGYVSERHVRRILDRLSSVSDCVGSDARTEPTETAA